MAIGLSIISGRIEPIKRENLLTFSLLINLNSVNIKGMAIWNIGKIFSHIIFRLISYKFKKVNYIK